MLEKTYTPGSVEDGIYRMWEESGAFTADAASTKEPFTISMPPPNATGQLHLGHAVMLALEDIFIRFQRMRGKEVIWVPGTDHAAIATENVVIRELKKKGMKDPRAKLGREKLVSEIQKYVEKSRGTIRSQIRKMGSSCDWSRERYTMDESLNHCVNEVFKQMHDDGIIYRGNRIVNWDPNLKTNVSDDEVAYVTRKDPFYWFRYGPFTIGTVRPETKFGDKYVVMHPEDKRYKQYKHGDTFECEWIVGRITATVLKDAAIDMKMGSGCMTITPWHSHVDFEIAARHGIDYEQIIDFDGTLLHVAGEEFAGMHIAEARPLVVETLRKKGLIANVDENYEHAVATSSRGGGMIEPQIREQWFIDVNKKNVQWKGSSMSLKEVMQDVIRTGDIRIIPERFEKVYFNWIDNLRDWCISRQIWWGHRIPVWYCSRCSVAHSNMGAKIRNPKSEIRNKHEIQNSKHFVSVKELERCPDCESTLTQDPDTLDTWFSAGIWTWSTLIDPKLAGDTSLSLEDLLKKSPDFQKFHPTSVMETGYDIIFFWVARMILMTTYATGQIPFRSVYLHGLVRTREGKKMSKSDPATCIDPLDMIQKYGADALRMSMIVGQGPGNDFRLYEEKIAGYRNFVNKLWNAARFVLLECEKSQVDPMANSNNRIIEYWSNGTQTLADRVLLSELQQLVSDVTEKLEEYRLSEAGERLYSFVWDFFCDWYLELSKGEASIPVLVHAMRTILALLHPYAPFVTEELWGNFKASDSDMLIKEPWPTAEKAFMDEHASADFRILADVITAIRSIRSEYAVESGKKINAVLVAGEHTSLLEEQQEHITRLARVEKLTIQRGKFTEKNAASLFMKHVEVHVPLSGLIDIAKERERLMKEKAQLETFLVGVQGKLKNEKFIENAAAEAVAKERQKEADAISKITRIEEKLSTLA